MPACAGDVVKPGLKDLKWHGSKVPCLRFAAPHGFVPLRPHLVRPRLKTKCAAVWGTGARGWDSFIGN